jgi:anti-sigma-K factor RskA
MTGEPNAMREGIEVLLHAYHDGELSGLARWRFERELRRSPALQRALAGLRGMREQIREIDAADPTPDLWDAIALRLPAADARRAGARDELVAARGRRLIWWLTPIGAAAAAAAVVLAVLYEGYWSARPASGGTVRWIESDDGNVMVLDDDPDTTIIWVLDGSVEGAARGGSIDVV